MKDPNLALDIAQLARGDRRVARLCVRLACSYLRDSGAPTITADCETVEDLAHEVERLKRELDSALEDARTRFAGSPALEAAANPARAQRAEPDSPKPRVESDLCVADVMTREVKTLGRNDKVSAADELMKVGRFRHLVVLADDDKVTGIVSQRDICYGAIAWTLGQGRIAHQKALASLPVKDVMQSTVETVHPSAPLPEAARIMMERKLGCLPVVDGEELVGILTEGDFLALLSDRGR